MKPWLLIVTLTMAVAGCANSADTQTAATIGQDERQALIQERTDELISKGLAPTDARAQACEEYGTDAPGSIEVHPDGASVDGGPQF